MSLKRSRGYLQAALWSLVALVFLGIQAIIVTHLVTHGDWGALLNPLTFFGVAFILLLVPIDLVLGVWPVYTIWRLRLMQALSNQDMHEAIIASSQPDVHLALRDGETLVLSWRRHTSGKLRRAMTRMLGCLVLSASGESIIIPLLPAISHALGNLIGFPDLSALPPPSPSTLDWVSAAFPIVLGVGLAPFMAVRALAGEKESVEASDQGIVVRKTFAHAQFIPWSDIRILARSDDDPLGRPEGSYVLWGYHHRLHFQIHGRGNPVAMRAEDDDPRNDEEFSGGYDVYTENGRRLLATIVARSFVPLRATRQATAALAWMRRHFPLRTLALDDVVEAPRADETLQPNPQTIVALPSHGISITLTARLSQGPILLESLVYFVGLAAAVLLFGGFVQSQMFSLSAALAGDLTSIIVYAVSGGLLLSFAYAFAYARRRQRRPSVTANDTGLRGSTIGSERTITLPWGDIRAWAVMPRTGRDSGGRTYVACSSDKLLFWIEPRNARLAGRHVAGDRGAAYRQEAERLHALIIARTNLPLHAVEMPTTAAHAASAQRSR